MEYDLKAIDLLTLQLDELIAMVETGLRSQRLAGLKSKGKGQAAETIKGQKRI